MADGSHAALSVVAAVLATLAQIAAPLASPLEALPIAREWRTWPALAWLVGVGVTLGWNIVYAGRIARLRRAPRPLAALSAACGLLVAPALVAHVASSSLYGGRAVNGIAWLWPLTTTLFVAQAAFATWRRFVTPFVGVPLLVWDVLTCLAAWTRFAVERQGDAPTALLALSAAQATVHGAAIGGAALVSPLAVQLPLLVPAYPARWRLTRTVRALLAVATIFAAGVLLLELPRGIGTVASYQPWASERLSERPTGDFAIGVSLLPPLGGPPPTVATRWDMPLLDSLDVQAVRVTVGSGALTLGALDSLQRTLDPARRDSLRLVVAIAFEHEDGARRRAAPERFDARRLALVERVARALRPDVLLPADAPYGATSVDAVGHLPVEHWRRFLTASAARVQAVNPNIRVGVAASSYDASDSTLYAWAASRASPVHVVGFEVAPSFSGGTGVDARLRAADRWMRAQERTRVGVGAAARAKPHWVFDVHAFPVTHGDASQERAVWHTLAWATAHPDVDGVVVGESGDYARMTGLRAASGRTRRVAAAISRASRALREAVVP
ncbi:hypothetical protein [Roseisolibacter agri]|uniref:Uncharacterized protein n=1 Tax=Roseisolibacter agri TaxID=2014610 RepID=A0AA37QCT1_9BACT|nr:hypothetical protein [Roseisolibacter agri]GLC24363.1 hypothetical protein rosag_08760 [Roseisolibacter agri]